MSNKTVSYEEQIAMGIIRKPVADNFVESSRQLPSVRPMTPADYAALQVATTPPQAHQVIHAPALPPSQHTGHLRDDFDVLGMATVAERFILWDMLIFGVITLAVTGLIWFQVGGDLTIYALGWLVVWGGVSYFAMHKNRGQAYDHSPSGVARLEQQSQVAMHDRSASVQEYQIDSQERVALHAIDRHGDLIERRWKLERGDHNES